MDARTIGAMIDKGDRDYATAVDVEVERRIREVLRVADSGIAFLGEEEGLSPAEAEAIWVLDPIDGTVNFGKASPLAAISLALIEGVSRARDSGSPAARRALRRRARAWARS